MSRTLSLREFVRRRNGLPLGAPGSLKNMLANAFGANAFDRFWWYWNPIWGYYLSTKVLRPCRAFLPAWLAILVTFLVSGGLHDLAVSLVASEMFVFFTPWFGVMGVIAVLSKSLDWSYGHLPVIARALINTGFLVSTFIMTRLLVM